MRRISLNLLLPRSNLSKSISQTSFSFSTRSISSTPHLKSLGWFDKIKGAITGKPSKPSTADGNFTLIQFAEQMDKARMLGALRKFEVGRCSEATMTDAFKKNVDILRYLGGIDPTGENLQTSHKIGATKHCNCTIAEVEHVLAKYTWAKEAQKKIEKLKEEGKPMPKSFNEVTKLMGSTPLDVGRSNLKKVGKLAGTQFAHVVQENAIRGVVELLLKNSFSMCFQPNHGGNQMSKALSGLLSTSVAASDANLLITLIVKI